MNINCLIAIFVLESILNSHVQNYTLYQLNSMLLINICLN